MVKNITTLLLTLIITLFSFSSCEELEPFLSDANVAKALKEALVVSSDSSVSQANRENGYFANAAIKILLPEEVQTASNIIKSNILGGEALLDELVLKLNRAAEDAAGEATPILVDAITGITISDALGILHGSDSAATVYLKDESFGSLKVAFQPKIEASLTKVGAQQAWSAIVNKYNSLAGTLLFPNAKPINTDLADYTTTKGLDGLFHLIAEEEKEIRTNVENRVTDLLREVFAKQDD